MFPVRPGPWPHSRRGFSLIEVAIAVSIFGIMVALGYGSIRNQLPRYRMVQAAKSLEQDIARIRMAAILANRETRLVLIGPDPAPDDPTVYGGNWELQGGDRSMMSSAWEYMPFDEAGTGDPDQSQGRVDIGPDGNRQERGVGLYPWEDLVGPGTGNADAVVFSPSGWVSNPAGDFDGQGYITLRIINKVALGEGVQDEVHIRIARSGYVRLETTLGSTREDFGVGTDGSSKNGS